jgi:hypothetical protein
LDAVVLEPGVGGDDGKPLGERLRHQQTVERVAVMRGEVADLPRVRCGDREPREAFVGDPVRQIVRSGELAE